MGVEVPLHLVEILLSLQGLILLLDLLIEKLCVVVLEGVGLGGKPRRPLPQVLVFILFTIVVDFTKQVIDRSDVLEVVAQLFLLLCLPVLAPLILQHLVVVGRLLRIVRSFRPTAVLLFHKSHEGVLLRQLVSRLVFVTAFDEQRMVFITESCVHLFHFLSLRTMLLKVLIRFQIYEATLSLFFSRKLELSLAMSSNIIKETLPIHLAPEPLCFLLLLQPLHSRVLHLRDDIRPSFGGAHINKISC